MAQLEDRFTQLAQSIDPTLRTWPTKLLRDSLRHARSPEKRNPIGMARPKRNQPARPRHKVSDTGVTVDGTMHMGTARPRQAQTCRISTRAHVAPALSPELITWIALASCGRLRMYSACRICMQRLQPHRREDTSQNMPHATPDRAEVFDRDCSPHV